MKYSLVGVNGNAYAIMGYVGNCMKQEGKTTEEINTYYETAKQGDYNNLLCVSMGEIEILNNITKEGE